MSKYILSIDDDEDILYTIQEICQSQGWISLLARSFDEAKEILCQQGGQSPDLILIDLQRPNMQPVHNLVKNLVYSGSKENVKMTMVNGMVLYENGEFFVGESPSEIYAKANEVTKRITQ